GVVLARTYAYDRETALCLFCGLLSFSKIFAQEAICSPFYVDVNLRLFGRMGHGLSLKDIPGSCQRSTFRVLVCKNIVSGSGSGVYCFFSGSDQDDPTAF